MLGSEGLNVEPLFTPNSGQECPLLFSTPPSNSPHHPLTMTPAATEQYPPPPPPAHVSQVYASASLNASAKGISQVSSHPLPRLTRPPTLPAAYHSLRRPPGSPHPKHPGRRLRNRRSRRRIRALQSRTPRHYPRERPCHWRSGSRHPGHPQPQPTPHPLGPRPRTRPHRRETRRHRIPPM